MLQMIMIVSSGPCPIIFHKHCYSTIYNCIIHTTTLKGAGIIDTVASRTLCSALTCIISAGLQRSKTTRSSTQALWSSLNARHRTQQFPLELRAFNIHPESLTAETSYLRLVPNPKKATISLLQKLAGYYLGR